MSDDYIEMQAILTQARSAGLDLKNRTDMQFYQNALDEYQGDSMVRDMPQIMSSAATKKKQSQPATEGLNDYFQVFREQERQKANKDKPKPQPKENKSATAALDDHFAEWRKKQGI